MIWMKKTAVILSATALLLSGCAVSQPNVPTEPENLETLPTITQTQPMQQPQITVLTAEKMQEIEDAWYAAMNTKMDGWYVENDGTVTDGMRYYGNCGGYDVLYVPSWEDAETSLVLGDVTISSKNGFVIYAYKDGQFRELKEVYQLGAISDEELEHIQGTHMAIQRRIYPLFYQPEADMGLYDQMKDAFLRRFVTEDGWTTDDLSVIYYGDYDGAHVAFINGILFYTQAMTSEKVGKLTFHYRTGQRLLLYYEGELMYLTEAYEKGILSDEAVAKLHRDFEQPSNLEKE